MKRIKLSTGISVQVDNEYFEWLRKFRWYPTKGKYTYYAITNMKLDNKFVTVRMHRLILGLKYKDGKQVDHIDHNGLNNQRNNLRIVNLSSNMANYCDRHKTNTSGFSGVFWRKDREKWMAAISLYGKLTYLGLFYNKIEAAKAFDRAVIKHRDKYAYTNYPRTNYF